MSEENVPESSLGVESLSIKTEPAKPAEIVKSKSKIADKIDKNRIPIDISIS
jgi:hypothetical protein